jgi:hypothetical protein
MQPTNPNQVDDHTPYGDQRPPRPRENAEDVANVTKYVVNADVDVRGTSTGIATGDIEKPRTGGR